MPRGDFAGGLIVIPGRAEGASPESIVTDVAKRSSEYFLEDQWLWIPGSSLRSAPE
jgi:hypothetical protein